MTRDYARNLTKCELMYSEFTAIGKVKELIECLQKLQKRSEQ